MPRFPNAVNFQVTGKMVEDGLFGDLPHGKPYRHAFIQNKSPEICQEEQLSICG